MYKRFTAFTLAEISIVLGIIGIVAEFTIPVLISNVQNAIYITGRKKAYSLASQVWSSAYANNEIQSRTDWFDEVNNKANFDLFKSKFFIIKECDSSNISECFPTPLLDQYNKADYSAFIDKSGMAWSAVSDPSSGKLKGYILIDTNGIEKPNVGGKDRALLCTVKSGSTKYLNGCPDTWDNAGIPNIIVPNSDGTTILWEH